MTPRRHGSVLLGAGCALALSLGATVAHAQDQGDMRPVGVEVDPAVSTIHAEDVRAAVTRELGVPAVDPRQAPAGPMRGTLRVMSDAEHRVVLEYRDATGRMVWRTVTAPSDPAASLATIAFLAGNLARNEADSLLAPPPAPSPPPVPAPPLVLVPVQVVELPRVEIGPVPVATTPWGLAPVGTTLLLREASPPVERRSGGIRVWAAGGLGVTSPPNGGDVSTGFAGSAGAFVQLYDSLGMDFGASFAFFSGGSGPRAYTYSTTQFAATPDLAVRLRAGPLRVQLGGGLALLYREGQSAIWWSAALPPTITSGNDFNPAFHAAATFGYAATPSVEFFLRTEGTLPFQMGVVEGIGGPGTWTTSLGIHLRVL